MLSVLILLMVILRHNVIFAKSATMPNNLLAPVAVFPSMDSIPPDWVNKKTELMDCEFERNGVFADVMMEMNCIHARTGKGSTLGQVVYISKHTQSAGRRYGEIAANNKGQRPAWDPIQIIDRKGAQRGLERGSICIDRRGCVRRGRHRDQSRGQCQRCRCDALRKQLG
jgi:hypothetical protein